MSVLKIKRVRENAKLPFRATEGSAGMDLYACIEEPVVIAPNGTQKIPTGLSIELEDRNQVALIFARSSMGIKHSVTPANAVGVVDSDYRGEVCVFLHNYSDVEYTVQPQDRVAQMLIMPVLLPEIEEVTELSDTERGEGGFGSTGK